ncbi:glycerol kinase 1 [Litorimonas cladophorae]|uniref:Glycerol kinase n=1 Tax=Litorimonas cladophorae TaxID=1220491 RepID=A0A918KR34_9PROT|nr:glycerol kinase GlpK [Litorimonas cladophorae]GGX71356.1 glycerol kinase 1 [Litorimonas cladophorae]
MTTVIFSIDQGTTSSRTLVFSPKGEILFTAQEEFPQLYPQDGWVEHDPEAIWSTVLSTLKQAQAYAAERDLSVAAIGITNQRETTLVWDRETGKPLYNAIVWQDRRTAEICRGLAKKLPAEDLQAKTGLLHDPYFSGSKMAWILDNVDGAREKAEHGELCFGTIDSFLIWRLTEGKRHVTDATNASRTNLFDIHAQRWDEGLLNLFNVPKAGLPEVLDCAADFGICTVLGMDIPITGVAGDQQAAAIGQACFEVGDIKSTYGTGCFVLLNTGSEAITSKNRLLTTVGYRIKGETTYALEGSIFMAGASVQWLRDKMKLVDDARETEAVCERLDSTEGVYLVPAFTGLGAPYWAPDARGAVFGMTRNTGRDQVIRATVESVVYQTYDLFDAMSKDGVAPTALRVDGGMTANSWMCGYLADILDMPVLRPKVLETTALGAAYLAGLGAGIYSSMQEVAGQWSAERTFTPSLDAKTRETRLADWAKYVQKLLS